MLKKPLSIVMLFGAACGNSGLAASPSPSPIDVAIVFTPVGDGATFTAQLDEKTYTAGGAVVVTLGPGTYEINGSFRGAGLGVGFQTIGSSGGAQSGSPRSLAGPSSDVVPCAITYSNSDTPSVERAFQLQFKVTSDPGSACSGSPP